MERGIFETDTTAFVEQPFRMVNLDEVRVDHYRSAGCASRSRDQIDV